MKLDPKAIARDSRFRPLGPGVGILVIYGDPTHGACSAFLRYDPGASVPLHRHRGHEQILVLDGEQSDEHGSYTPGSLVVNAPGSVHSVHSRTGCLVLITWQDAVAFV
jgi:anti-sigma factor ChrR (cupin superfamily)